MAYWLAKSEPSTYSWDDLVKEKQTCWSGIRNYAARIHMRNMKKGDEVFFYHSNEGVEIVGIAKVIKEAYPDPTTTLIKKEKSLKEMALVRISRLSLQPVSDDEWEIVMKMAGEK